MNVITKLETEYWEFAEEVAFESVIQHSDYPSRVHNILKDLQSFYDLDCLLLAFSYAFGDDFKLIWDTKRNMLFCRITYPEPVAVKGRYNDKYESFTITGKFLGNTFQSTSYPYSLYTASTALAEQLHNKEYTSIPARHYIQVKPDA